MEGRGLADAAPADVARVAQTPIDRATVLAEYRKTFLSVRRVLRRLDHVGSLARELAGWGTFDNGKLRDAWSRLTRPAVLFDPDAPERHDDPRDEFSK